MVDLCLNCGDRGVFEALTFCNECKVYAVHLYCLPEIPDNFDDVIWLCEDCETESLETVEEKNNSIRKSKRISDLIDSSESLNTPKDQGLEKSSSLQLDLENINNDGELERQNRLDDKCNTDEGVESVGSRNAPLNLRESQVLEINGSNVTEFNQQGIDASNVGCSKDSENQKLVIAQSTDIVEHIHVPAQPIEQPIWRGHMSISDYPVDGMLGLTAHLSNLACPRVNEEVKLLPLLLSSELLPRTTFWPKSFAKWGPSDDSIALYFFPDSESSERIFDRLVNDMINQDLGLRASVQNAELRIFVSRLMPMDYWRFQAKYYLWGVFKGKRSLRSAANGVSGGVKAVAKVSDSQSPISPLSNGSNGLGSPFSSLSLSMR